MTKKSLITLIVIPVAITQSHSADFANISAFTVNKNIMETLEKNAAVATGTSPSPLSSSYGTMVYRLSAAQSELYRNLKSPQIILPDPDSGIPDRILGGVQVQQSSPPWRNVETPWHVALMTRNGILFCGGSHIGRGWIVTAAHCLSDRYGRLRKEDILVKVGTTYLNDNAAPMLRLESDFVVHEEWNPLTMKNDIALLKVRDGEIKSSVSITDVKPGDSLLQVSGWGKTTENGQISVNLLKVDVPVVPGSSCKNAYPSLDSLTQICAGGRMRDSCQGDSGGPLYTVSGQNRALVGIVSYGYGCGREGYPGVYTYLSAYLPWLASKTGMSLAESYTTSRQLTFVSEQP